MCRELAPGVFGYSDSDQSRVVRQPEGDAEWHRAMLAVVACPTASIGAERSAREASRAFPVPLDGPVHWAGYASEDSYGAHAYFVRRDGGNLLVDSPRAAAPLVTRLRALGGVKTMFLTHRDDVADHAEFRAAFGCERVIHEADDFIGAEGKLRGDAPVELAPGVLAIPVPGHTRGSCALLVDHKYLFTGDHLWADPDGHLGMGRGVCWYSWPEQKRSLRRLLDFEFEWVLPGHGRSLHLPAVQMRRELERASALDR
jgi:glyoxylase-like metal-dependent hydrolase (beta-lactamase superfamily II)